MCYIVALSQFTNRRPCAPSSEVRRARNGNNNPEGLRKTLLVSLGAHTLVIAGVLLGPAGWFSGQAADEGLDVMTLRLGGPQGPGEGGLTPMGGRPVQKAVTLEEARRPEWVQRMERETGFEPATFSLGS